MSDLNTTPTSAAAPGRRSILTAGALGIGALTLGASTAQATGRPASSVPTTTAGFSTTGRGWGAKGKIPHGLVRTRLIPWARDTWRSLDQMTVRATGLVADNTPADDLAKRSGHTSPTNIGGYLWSALIARELGFITARDCSARIRTTLTTLARMERHRPSGMYYNWYDEATGEVLRAWPGSGDKVVPFVSSVDMGWLGAALWVVANADLANRRVALELYNAMRWDVFFDPDYTPAPGAIYGGFYTEDPGRGGVALMEPRNGVGGPKIWYTVTHHYDTCVSEARMALYLGIIRGQIPAGAFYATWRTFPPDWTWPEMPPVGQYRTYFGVRVYEGAHRYRGMRVVPGWGGSMFEELMPDLFVPEAAWAPRSWGVNHPLHVRSQREHGLNEARYGYWGFSPSSDPFAEYREYGVDALGLNPEGYFSDREKTDYKWDNPPTRYGDGVVTPHAPFLAMMYEPREAIDNLTRLQKNFDCYGRGGFHDAIAVRSGTVAHRHLSLDQAMIMGALGNVILGDRLKRWFATGEVERRLRPVIAPEVFGAGR